THEEVPRPHHRTDAAVRARPRRAEGRRRRDPLGRPEGAQPFRRSILAAAAGPPFRALAAARAVALGVVDRAGQEADALLVERPRLLGGGRKAGERPLLVELRRE